MVEPVDVDDTPLLQGIFAPVHDELDDAPCEVVQGQIPDDLVGTYLRNGPNPRFPPLGSYTYPLDGDGMIHAVTFEDGGARYRNRSVRTPTLAAEEAAGRALWGGVMTPVAPPPEEVGPELAGQLFRDMPDIHVVRHGGRLLALAEGDPPYALGDDLSTIGPWDFGGRLPGMCAHPRMDPVSGEMVVFRYGFEPPLLTWATVGPDGAVTDGPTEIEIDATYMIHDAVISQRYLVLFVLPLLFDFTSPEILRWDPERGTRIAVVPRDGSGPIRWLETDAMWIWHFANAYEDGDEIVVDYPHWSHPTIGHTDPATGGVQRAVLDPTAGTVKVEDRDAQICEFPRLDERRIGRRHRFFHTAAKDPDHPSGTAQWNRLLRYDVEGGTVAERRTGPVALGEAVFAPGAGADPDDEDAGYVLTYTYDTRTLETGFLVLHAADVGGEPAATLRMPRRVPFGLHGSWIPGR